MILAGGLAKLLGLLDDANRYVDPVFTARPGESDMPCFLRCLDHAGHLGAGQGKIIILQSFFESCSRKYLVAHSKDSFDPQRVPPMGFPTQSVGLARPSQTQLRIAGGMPPISLQNT
ncbi:hypothetical protein ACVDG5_007815 [Mesorhizobium sp. ORM6]